ncbi:protein of unknown function [Candidatus Methylomirabilis oxygeniifera]|uniref:Uncharacterized protein n=1 Tax=Methylomirabilis oxygeniifera TaxID=671143 RepID=D5MKC9_METO1|nr:protein of unknown function [Candidatus Methylomirabilis oxyfera]
MCLGFADSHLILFVLTSWKVATTVELTKLAYASYQLCPTMGAYQGPLFHFPNFYIPLDAAYMVHFGLFIFYRGSCQGSNYLAYFVVV